MARVSRKKGKTVPARQEAAIFPTAIYVRLSVEDNGKVESESLENQRELLEQYVKANPELKLADVYEDNGFTGTDFSRPAFQRMLEDAQKGKITCIVVKDLSRLGRNYVEAGNYLEKVFPFLGVRFIAVNDQYDSQQQTPGEDLGVNLKNLINDIYAKDISRKTGSALQEKRRQGEFVGSYAPYGYVKDPQDKNHLIADPETAPYVVEIFQMRASGMGVGTILRQLNDRGVPSPGKLRLDRGILTNHNKQGKGLLWNRHVLKTMLENVAYIGHLAQGKGRSSLYKGIPFHSASPSEWDCAVNTHQAIVPWELWQQVQQVNEERSNQAKAAHGKYDSVPKRENPYGELLRCGHCGRVMKQVCSYTTRKNSGTRRFYMYKCSLREEAGVSACACPGIRAADLDNIVLELLRKQMDTMLDAQKVLQERKALEQTKIDQMNLPKQLARLRNELNRRRQSSVSLYTDFKEGLLTKEEYLYGKETYQREIAGMEQEIKQLEELLHKVEVFDQEKQVWQALTEKYGSASQVTKEMVRDLIEKLWIVDGQVTVEFRYRDELEELLRAPQNRREVVA